MKGNKYGTHRVKSPKGVLPQPALILDSGFNEIYDNEILFDVDTLNIDSASFINLSKKANNDPEKVAGLIDSIVKYKGKMQNPDTGSGGMFIGRVAKIGQDLDIDLKVGDKVASLVSLSLTPLRIDKISNIDMETGKVDIVGQAVLFESGVWTKIPSDLPEALVLSVLDVAGAPAQTRTIVNPGDTVAVLGARGKSGMLCCYEAKKRGARVIAVIHSSFGREVIDNATFIDDVIIASADDAQDLLDKVEKVTDGELCDIVISCVSRENCEMGAILITKDRGLVYFFSMATSFTKAALGAEGVGKDIDMLIGNGYSYRHAEIALEIMRKSRYLKEIYTLRYC